MNEKSSLMLLCFWLIQIQVEVANTGKKNFSKHFFQLSKAFLIIPRKEE